MNKRRSPNTINRAPITSQSQLRFTGRGGRSYCVNLKKRIMALEKQLRRDPIFLTLEDGQERVIPLRPGETALDVFQRVMNNPDGDEGQMVRRCVAVREPGGGRLLQMAKALLDPVTDDLEALESAQCRALESLAVEGLVQKPSDAIR